MRRCRHQRGWAHRGLHQFRTPAGARGRFPEPTILRVAVPDAAVVDSDADGLPDVWELDHLQTLAHGADGDADSDGQTNRDEFIARTLPGEPASLLAMFSVEAIAGDSTSPGRVMPPSPTNWSGIIP